MYRPVTLADAPALARLHRQVLERFFLAQRGEEFLALLYRGLLEAPEVFGLVYCDPPDRVAGFILGATDSDRLYRRVIRRRFWPLTRICLAQALRHPILFFRIFETFLYMRRVRDRRVTAEGLTVGLDREYRGREIGKGLYERFLDQCRERGIVEAKVGIAKTNLEIRGILESHGARITKEFTVYGREGYLYVFPA